MARGPQKNDAPFDSRKISASRVNAYVTCGVAFRMKYVEKLPPQRSGSAALFGSVMHEAMEKWTPNREADLLQLVRGAWLTVTEGTAVKDFLAAYAPLSVAAIKQEHAIREAWAAKGKESKAPRMTKEWKDSDVAKKIGKLLQTWLPKLEAGSPWRFKERDQLPSLYDESLVLARRTEARLGHLPPTLHTEFAFDIEWRGYRPNGYIDAIEAAIDQATGELKAILVIDYKSYAKPPAERKDYRQLVKYDVAIRELVERGALEIPGWHKDVPVYVGVDYLRWTEGWKDDEGNPYPGGRRFWRMSEADHDRLEKEFGEYVRGVEAEVFLPAQKGQNPDFCDYPDNCCLKNTSAAGGCAERVEVPA